MVFSVLRIWPTFGSIFRFSCLKYAVFGFGFLCGLRVLSKMTVVFWTFLSNAFYGFYVVKAQDNIKAIRLFFKYHAPGIISCGL